MAPKRNDPCHCGSGKKYKHCHKKTDREAEAAAKEEARSVPVPTSTPDDLSDHDVAEALAPAFEKFAKPDLDDEPKENDPEMERLNQLYSDFEDAEYDEKVALVRKSIEEKVLDGELAFEIFDYLQSAMAERNDRAGFAELVGLLKSNQPDVYAEESQWFWSWEVSNALVLGDDKALQLATDQLIQNGGKDLDQFYPVFQRLLYHDRRDVLLTALDKYTMDLSKGDYFTGVELEINQHMLNLLIHDYLETHEQSELLEEKNIDALCARLQKYIKHPDDFSKDGLLEFLGQAGGCTPGTWTPDDFAFRKISKRRDSFWDDDEKEAEVDPAVANLRDLSTEFLYYARTVEGIAYNKSELARSSFVEYILERHAGELEPVEGSPFDFLADGGPSRKKKAHGKKSRKGSKKKQSENMILIQPWVPLCAGGAKMLGFNGG